MRLSQTILIIDDEESIRDIVRLMLERLGLDILEAKTGLAAVNLVKTYEGPIDLSLLDIGLPDIEGPELYPLIMEVRPEMKTIVCSGYSLDDSVQAILSSGAQDYIQKPFSLETFSNKLKKVLESNNP
jgi:two-component system cell cycle sensor histidine kinase/response regulator CckA